MDVDPEQAKYSHEHDGQTYYFCSAHCLNRFRFDPGQYTGASAPAPASPTSGPSRRGQPSLGPRRPCCAIRCAAWT